jgi:IS1 family transposase
MDSLYALAGCFNDENAARDYLIEHDVFNAEKPCPKCKSIMIKDVKNWIYRCDKRSCRLKKSMNNYTFFAGTKLKSNEILMLARLWTARVSVTSAIELTGHSPNTVVAFWKHFRQLTASTLEDDSTIVGGPGLVVEVDETKIGKRKYNRGHKVEGTWVIVGVERTTERKMFAVPVETRDENSLRTVIVKHVAVGSIVYTDGWRAYSWLDNDPRYSHQVVNHSISFKDEETGTHTNTVEGTNSGLKTFLPVRSRVREGMEGRLAEFVWRRNHENENLWLCFISALRDISYILVQN